MGPLAVGKGGRRRCVLRLTSLITEPAEVLDTVSELTVSGGKIVYEANVHIGLAPSCEGRCVAARVFLWA